LTPPKNWALLLCHVTHARFSAPTQRSALVAIWPALPIVLAGSLERRPFLTRFKSCSDLYQSRVQLLLLYQHESCTHSLRKQHNQKGEKSTRLGKGMIKRHHSDIESKHGYQNRKRQTTIPNNHDMKHKTNEAGKKKQEQ